MCDVALTQLRCGFYGPFFYSSSCWWSNYLTRWSRLSTLPSVPMARHFPVDPCGAHVYGTSAKCLCGWMQPITTNSSFPSQPNFDINNGNAIDWLMVNLHQEWSYQCWSVILNPDRS